MPTREEVDLARAAIDRGLLTVPESVACLKIQQEHADRGHVVSLERILIEEGLLNERQIQSLKDSLSRMDALRHIAHYKILGKLGSGGMGTVYKAEDTRSGREVALKVLSPGHASDREYIQRFLRETKASGQLSHPNIVQGYDAGEADGQYYFAMEHIEGTTVGEMLRESKPIPEQQALDIAIQIAKALQHAEENDLVHRDVKPDNIMVTEDGTAKLADLGLARRVSSRLQETRELGTVYYASPEQCEGDEEVDNKSDMYAFGVTIFHMLAGHVPFDGRTVEDIMALHVQERPPYLKDLNVQLSHGISKIVRKLMAKYKRDRYDSMEDVVTDLVLVRMGRSPRLGQKRRHDSGEYRYRSATGSWRTKTPTRWQKARLIALCAGVGLLILAGSIGLFHLFFGRSGPADRVDETQAPSDSPAPRTAAEIYYQEEVLARADELQPHQLLLRLRSVEERYPGTEPAEEAAQQADELEARLEAHAARTFRRLRTEFDKLIQEQRFGEALQVIDQFPEQYRVGRYAGEDGRLARLRAETESSAAQAFERIAREADALVEEGRFDDAARKYDQVRQTFGIRSFRLRALEKGRAVERARAEAEAEAERRLAEEEQRRQEQQTDQNRQADLETIRAALEQVLDLNERLEFERAAAQLEATIDNLQTDEPARHIRAAVRDLDKLSSLVEKLGTAQNELRDKEVELELRDGTAIQGRVMSVRRNNLILFTETGAVRAAEWNELDPNALRTLIRQSRDELTLDERSALAALFYFHDRSDAAERELERLAEVPGGKQAAERSRAYMKLFGEVRSD